MEKQNRFHKAMTRKLKTDPTNKEIQDVLNSLKGGSSHFQNLKKKAYDSLKNGKLQKKWVEMLRSHGWPPQLLHAMPSIFWQKKNKMRTTTL